MSGADPGRGRRTWPQRLLITFNAVAVVAALGTAGVLAYSNDRLAEVQRVELSDVTRADDVARGEPQNFLVVGVDDASGLPQGDSVRNRPSGAGMHTDTIMVLRIDPRTTTAALLSFPRDLWVPIAETDSRQRINTALETGGPRRLIKTIHENFGIPVHHYLQVDFAGFRQLVEVVDGISVHFPRPVRSRSSGLAIEEAGCWTLGPEQALGFSRARKDYQVQDDDGRWHTDLGGDYSRVERQQLFVELAMRRAITKGARNPNTLRRLVDLGVGAVRIDDALEPESMVDLALRFRSFDPEELVTHTLPITEDYVGGAAVLFLQEEAAEPVLDVFRGGPSGDAGGDPADVTVQVRNGSGTQGQARDVTEELADAGFETVVASTSDPVSRTTLLHADGDEDRARLVARHLEGPVRYEVARDLGGADVVVVTGSDWEGVTPEARPAEDVPGPTTTEGAGTSTSTTEDGASTTEAGGEDGGEVTESDDPDDPGFYRARAPAPGSRCRPTG